MRTFLAVLLLLTAQSTWAMERLSGWCEKGATPVAAPSTVGGQSTVRYFQQSFPSCTVTVNVTGGGAATIYSTNTSTALANPFQANSTGYWFFYAANGTYDVTLSGGGLAAPVTFGARTLFDSSLFSPTINFSAIAPGTNTGALVMGSGGSMTFNSGSSLVATGTSTVNFSGAAHTRPFIVSTLAGLPGGCQTSEMAYVTDVTAGLNTYGCSSGVWTQQGGSGGGGGGAFLPLAGGTMTGVITTRTGQGAIYMPYNASLQMQVSPTSGQSATCTGGFGNCPDTTLVDYFGFEGVFHRIKGGGDYFDWARWGPSTTALPLHQLDLNDSSFNTVLHIDGGTYPATKFGFSGEILLGYCNDPFTPATCTGQAADVGITRNSTGVLEVNTGTPGTMARMLGKSFIATETGAGNLAFQGGGGTFQVLGNGLVGAANYNVGTVGTIQWNGQAAFRYNTGHVEFSDDGMTWTPIATTTGSQWTLVGSLLYPSSTSDKVLIRRNTDDGTGKDLQVLGSISLTGNNVAPEASNIVIDTNNATNGQLAGSTCGPGTDTTCIDDRGIEGNFFRMKTHLDYFDWTNWGTTNTPLAAHTLQLRDAGNNTLMNYFASGLYSTTGLFTFTGGVTATLDMNATNLGLTTSGVVKWNGQSALRYNGGHVQFSDDGSTWVDLGAVGGSNWTLGSSLLYPNSTLDKVLVARSTDDTSGAMLQVNGDIHAIGNISGTLAVGSTTTGTNVGLQVNGGKFQALGNGTVGAVLYNVAADGVLTNGGTYAFAGQPAFRYSGGHTQVSDNGTVWFDITGIASSGWTLSSGLLYPTSTATKVLVGRTTDDGSGAIFQVNGNINATGGISNGQTIQSLIGGSGVAFQAGGGAFQVLANGLVGAANFNVGAGGTIQFNAQPAFRNSGGNLQWYDGASWNTFTTNPVPILPYLSTIQAQNSVGSAYPIFGTVATNQVVVRAIDNGGSTGVRIEQWDGTRLAFFQQGGIVTIDGNMAVAHAVQSLATGTSVGFQVNGGKVQALGNGTVGAVAFNVASDGILAAGGTYMFNGQQALRYSGGHVQFSDDGSTWANVASSGSTNYWGLSGSTLTPISASYSLLVGPVGTRQATLTANAMTTQDTTSGNFTQMNASAVTVETGAGVFSQITPNSITCANASGVNETLAASISNGRHVVCGIIVP